MEAVPSQFTYLLSPLAVRHFKNGSAMLLRSRKSCFRSSVSSVKSAERKPTVAYAAAVLTLPLFLTGPFILRRLKEEVLDQLPSKIVHVNIVEMEEEQKKLYNFILERELEKRKMASSKKQEQKPSGDNGDANGIATKGRRRSAMERWVVHLENQLCSGQLRTHWAPQGARFVAGWVAAQGEA